MTTTTTRLNDVDIERVASLAQKIAGEPHVGDTKWSAEVTWNGGFRSEARIRDFGPAKSDEPEQLGGTNSGPNPVEQVLAALGNCLAVGYAANATASGIEIKGMKITVEGDLDLHTFLGLTEGNAGFSGIQVTVDLDTDADRAALDELNAKVVGTSPVGHTLNRAVPLQVKIA